MSFTIIGIFCLKNDGSDSLTGYRMTEMQTHQQIVNLQRLHMDNDYLNPKRKDLHESWFKENTVDSWRHKRMYRTILPIADHYIEKKWLSIGDGRYGLDAYRLKKLFNINVFPTDISGEMLARGKELGFVKEFGIENSEKLSFDENAFDIVFCKESFHHFPRPIIALYEMIRVCKSAVILIEPNDSHVLNHPRLLVKASAKWLLSRILRNAKYNNYNFSFFFNKAPSFEKSGNFVYTLSKREIEKIVHALNLDGFAWKGLNDYYLEGCEFEPAESNNKVFKQVKSSIKKMDKRCKRLPLFSDWNLITAVIFKKRASTKLKKEMQSFGYKFSEIEPNPYL